MASAVTELSSATREVVVGRQPIVDADGQLVGYELLYRSSRPTPAVLTGAQMTAEVLIGALTIGLDQLVGDKLLFCNADRDVLLGDPPVALSPHSTVIEVLESVTIDEEVLESCRELVARGFQLALDDFVWADGLEELLDLAWVVKIDVLAHSSDEVVELVRRCGAHDVLLLAEKVETAEQLAWAREVGFHLFQGYVIERPAQVRGRALPATLGAQLRLAVHVLVDDLDFREIEEVLRREPGLVVQVLQMASRGRNHGLRGEIRTIREALVVLGSVRVRQWIALTLLQEHRSVSTESVFTALVRAKACEVLARSTPGSSADVAFTAGLLSALDLLLGVPTDELVEALDLDTGLKQVAFEGVGEVGALVSQVAGFQDDLARGFPVPADTTREDAAIADAVAEAVAWAAPQVTALA